ncbi:MAG TPA: amidohydrolase family protein, partial [Streptosporangiaceae bacterium]|nr:amidohydrolase family protein [Streptosporangiaceae bacterium]
RFGMSPIDAIRSATTVAAELLGLGGVAGTLRPGAIADVIAVPGDPREDVKRLSRVDFVMRAGRVIKQP